MPLHQHTDDYFNCEFGHRPVNNWGSGNLPAPYAEGDTLWLPLWHENSERLEGLGHGKFTVTTVLSVDEGDAWYCRVDNEEGVGSGRLHVSFPERCVTFPEKMNFMDVFDRLETADPDGLALREQMLTQDWKPLVGRGKCPHCGGPL